MAAWVYIQGSTSVQEWARARTAFRRASIHCELRGEALWVQAAPEVQFAWTLVGRLRECHRLVVEAAVRTNRPYQPYKHLDLPVMLAAATAAVAEAGGAAAQAGKPTFVAALLHEFVWAQGLPNANHRAGLLLADEILHPPGSMAPGRQEFQAAGERFIAASKPLVLSREHEPDPDHNKRRHRRLADDFVALVGVS